MHANCTVNCTYQVTNGSFYGLSYEHGKEIWPLFKSGFYAGFQRDCEIRQAQISFFTVFGVLFAGVTGIMAGANVSGELKNPSKSIPSGTFKAIGFTFIVYTTIFFATAMTNQRNLLYHDCLYMISIDISGGYIILIGALLVTSCACLNCMIGASKVFEAIVADSLPDIFLKKIFSNRLISALTAFILMLCMLFIGSLNKIAQMSSVFFLLSYFTVNLACLFLEWASAPNFRPKFTAYSIYTCSIGCIGCLVMMFVINQLFTAVAWLILLGFIAMFNFFPQLK